ncbi:MAG: hypothetical protein V4727_12135 [Verrucomicrobiota bacterium]
MSEKAKCPECGVEFLQSTAESNGGFCLKCKPSETDFNHDKVAETLELGMRLLLASVFAFVFAGLGYISGAAIWTGVGVILALVCLPIGFIYGFFCREINFFIRSFLRIFLNF